MNPDGRKSPADRRRQAHLLRKRFGMEPRMVKDFESVLTKDLRQLDKWEIIRQEREVVWKLLRSAGAVEGAAAVAFTFFGLNRLPRYLARHAARKQHRQANPYVLDKLAGKKTSPFQTPPKEVVEKQVVHSRRRILFMVMELLFDCGMSLGVGAGVAFLASDENEAEQVFVSVPLQPGRSLLSDKLCNNLLEEYQRQWKKDADSREVLREPHHRVLQLIKGLAQNCRHRQVMENQLREDQGLQSATPVEIPDTGVIPLSDDALLVMMQEQMGEFNSTGLSQEDAASFVLDQEDDS